MEIRHTTEADLARVMDIYAHARAFMAAHGNPDQWGPTNWPPEALIRQDIARGRGYVCVQDGTWLDDSPYGVVHRIASDGSVKGVGAFCIDWAFRQCGHLRIDTHGDNIVMQKLLARLGFRRCGTIYVEEDDFPRFAYEKL